MTRFHTAQFLAQCALFKLKIFSDTVNIFWILYFLTVKGLSLVCPPQLRLHHGWKMRLVQCYSSPLLNCKQTLFVVKESIDNVSLTTSDWLQLNCSHWHYNHCLCVLTKRARQGYHWSCLTEIFSYSVFWSLPTHVWYLTPLITTGDCLSIVRFTTALWARMNPSYSKQTSTEEQGWVATLNVF